MPFAISVVGRSNAGKTTLLEKLVGELKRRGCNLATIKHVASDFDLDRPGKDSWRLAKAGSDTVVLSSPRELALIRPVKRETTLEELLHLVGEGFDLILIEGFKNSSLPKIEVHRRELGGLLTSPEELLALVTDERLDIAVPQFSPGEVEALADLIEKKSLAKRRTDDILLTVNGTPISLNPFVKRIIGNTLLGMVSSLSDVEEVTSLRISIQKGQN
ncbi:MAG: molybdopterin-guanine dinucleotide biosynthesis protein B [Chloroflexi bacterium]|nr:molybdopterin-guanine dinucleotide biosynthesis protein B [Chloroflexota bacterium]